MSTGFKNQISLIFSRFQVVLPGSEFTLKFESGVVLGAMTAVMHRKKYDMNEERIKYKVSQRSESNKCTKDVIGHFYSPDVLTRETS